MVKKAKSKPEVEADAEIVSSIKLTARMSLESLAAFNAALKGKTEAQIEAACEKIDALSKKNRNAQIYPQTIKDALS